MKVIRCYGILGHGKVEVAAGIKLSTSVEMVNPLSEKFAEKSNPSYFFKDIVSGRLDELRQQERLKVYSTIKSSSKFQVLVFTLNKKLRAATRLCICEKCKVEYGSCQLFHEYALMVCFLKKKI